jgi:hypothetical protein
MGLGFTAIGVVACLAGVWTLGALGLLLGLALVGFMAPSLTDLHNVCWSSEGVEGPCREFGLTLGLRRTAISWGDIRRTGKTLAGYWYIEAADGRRIYWSFLYRGCGVFASRIAAKCPKVPVPPDMRG